MSKEIRYGRGKFTHHDNYISYQLMIANHPNYDGMPGAFLENGKPLWQTSSGKGTSFYKFYEARREWWTKKADKLGIPGEGKEGDRWTIAARMIHPTGYRRCLVCGKDKNVGYFYLNKPFAKKLLLVLGSELIHAPQAITEAIDILRGKLSEKNFNDTFATLFPERAQFFKDYGVTPAAFERSMHLRSPWLSPGYMGNPPDRFDGLHDYCTECRKSNDPGRFDKNMQTYNHDRRAFEWWAEGNWALADTLFNSAGPGTCDGCSPPRLVKKVSPDHIGPLACGFKHLPFFRPLCGPCNSSKNRRMTLQDVSDLIKYEEVSGDSPASWHVRQLWDHFKHEVDSSSKAEELSAIMRALQDLYLRCLYNLAATGQARFLRTLLRPEYAKRAYTLEGLDPALLTFTSATETIKDTKNRRKLAARIVRIAFDELKQYVEKEATERRIRQIFTDKHPEIIDAITKFAAIQPRTKNDKMWHNTIIKSFKNIDACEAEIAALLAEDESPVTRKSDIDLRNFMLAQFAQLTKEASL